MKNIKLFNAFGVDEAMLVKLKNEIMQFFCRSDKYKYDEVHIHDVFENDDDIKSVVLYFEFSDRVIYYDVKDSSNLVGGLPSLKDIHNRMLLDRLTAQSEEIVKKNGKPPKLEITHLEVNEDGALRIIIDAKEYNDPNTFLKVMRGLRKVLREHEEEIING